MTLHAISTDSMGIYKSGKRRSKFVNMSLHKLQWGPAQIVSGDFNRLYTGFCTLRGGWWHTWRGAQGQFESFRYMASGFLQDRINVTSVTAEDDFNFS